MDKLLIVLGDGQERVDKIELVLAGIVERQIPAYAMHFRATGYE